RSNFRSGSAQRSVAQNLGASLPQRSFLPDLSPVRSLEGFRQAVPRVDFCLFQVFRIRVKRSVRIRLPRHSVAKRHHQIETVLQLCLAFCRVRETPDLLPLKLQLQLDSVLL